MKAILFTRSSLQQGAFNFAMAKGIAVVRILDDDSLSWLIKRTNKHLVTSQPNAITINVLNAKNDTFGFIKEKACYYVKGILEELFRD